MKVSILDLIVKDERWPGGKKPFNFSIRSDRQSGKTLTNATFDQLFKDYYSSRRFENLLFKESPLFKAMKMKQ